MRIQLDQVRDQPFTWTEDLHVDAASLTGLPISRLSAIACSGHASAVHPGHLIRVGLGFDQTLSCDRCLEHFVRRVDSELVVIAVTEERQNELPEEQQLEADDLDIVAVQDGVLDTEPLVVEQVLLQVPMKPLCSDDCQGLCVQCGQRRAEGPCGCKLDDTDPRWAALEDLRDSIG